MELESLKPVYGWSLGDLRNSIMLVDTDPGREL